MKNELFVNFSRKWMRLHALPKGNREESEFFKTVVYRISMLLFRAFNINTTNADVFHFAHAKRSLSLNEQESFVNQLFFR